MTARFALSRYLQEVVLPYEADDCLLWPFSKGHGGYSQISIGRKARYVHRLVCQEIHGEPPSPEHEAAHSCGNRACVNARHLSWKTRSQNAADKVTHGTDNRGERHNLAKLREPDVLAIRAMRGLATQEGLGRQYGVSQAAISQIQLGKRWASSK